MIVYITFFLILFFWFKRYGSPVLTFILLFYVVASICGLLDHYLVNPGAYCTVASVVFHLICLFAFIYPVIAYGKKEKVRTFSLLDDKRFKILSWTLISLQLFSILFFAEGDYNLIVSGEFARVRNEILFADINEGRSIFRTIAGVASYYYCFNILLFFYSLAFRNDSKLFLYLLIGTSISRIFHALTYVGRDGILFWVLSFLFSYFLFLPYLKKDAKDITKKVFIVFGTFAIVLIILISLSRFGSSDSGTFLSIIDYFGQPLNNFGLLFDRYHEQSGTKAIFPLLYGSRGGSGAASIANAELFYSKYGFYSNGFFTFIGNFYRAWGAWITLFLSIIYGILMSNRLNRKNVSMPTLIVLMFSSQIILHNYFYWAYSIRVANLFIFTLPLFVLFCGKTSKKPKELPQDNKE